MKASFRLYLFPLNVTTIIIVALKASVSWYKSCEQNKKQVPIENKKQANALRCSSLRNRYGGGGEGGSDAGRRSRTPDKTLYSALVERLRLYNMAFYLEYTSAGAAKSSIRQVLFIYLCSERSRHVSK